MTGKVVTPEQINEMRAAFRRGKKRITLKLKDKRYMTFVLSAAGAKHFRYRADNAMGLPVGVVLRKEESPGETFKRLWPDG